jgi:asparagine synthase (glutamine-hydrolysing)
MRTGFDVELCEDTAIGRLYRAAPDGSPRNQLVSQAIEHAGGRVCVLLGRLHYKEDLIRDDSTLPGRAFASDAALALAVFGARGAQGLARLEGEFSLVVIDPADRCLYALRDPLGNWPLYWAKSADRLVVGTSLLDLARRVGGTRINLEHVGAFLMWSLPGGELPREDTALEPLRRVPPGHLLRLDSDGAVTMHEHGWPRPAESEHLDWNAVGSRFLELLRDAVRQRLEPGSTAAHLSGGMDSSSVVCLARDLLAAHKGIPPLHTFSSVSRQPTLASEGQYIQMVLDQGGSVASHFMDGDQMLNLDWFEPALPEYDEPFGFRHQVLLYARSVEEAEAVGATTILTGEGAEVVAEGYGYYLADLIRQGHWGAALRDAQARARRTGVSPWFVLRRWGMGPLVPSWLRDGVGTLCRRGWGRWPDVGQSAIPPWIRPMFAREHRLWAKGREAIGRFYRAPYEESASGFAAECSGGNWCSWHLAAPRGLHISRPFLDPRLIAFSLSLPHRLRFKPGVAKPLLQSAMKGILPEPIRTRQWKRNFNSRYRLGLSLRLEALEDMVQRSAIADLGIIDRSVLRTVLRQVAAGLGRSEAGFRTDNTLALIAWYDQMGPALARLPDEPCELVRSVPGSSRCR